MPEKAEKPKTVTVETLKWHTYHGEEYDVEDRYDADEPDVASLQAQGMATPVEEGAARTPVREDKREEKTPEPPAARKPTSR